MLRHVDPMCVKNITVRDAATQNKISRKCALTTSAQINFKLLIAEYGESKWSKEGPAMAGHSPSVIARTPPGLNVRNKINKNVLVRTEVFWKCLWVGVFLLTRCLMILPPLSKWKSTPLTLLT